jgi:hypothetical protein
VVGLYLLMLALYFNKANSTATPPSFSSLRSAFHGLLYI